MNTEILAVTSHRNGVGGEPFRVALVRDLDEDRTMLMIRFDTRGHFAAIDVEQAAAGNIFGFQQFDENSDPIPDTGNNAWRGDAYEDALGEEIDRLAEQSSRIQWARSDLYYARKRAEREAEQA